MELLSCTDVEQKAHLYNKISDEYLDINLEIAQKYADSALVLGNKLSDNKVISDAWVNYANTYYYYGNLDSALICCEISYHTIIRTSDYNEIAAALNRLGLVYEAKSDFVKATEYYFEALDIYEFLKNRKGMADSYNNLGVIHHNFDLNNKALEFYNLSLLIYIEVENSDGQANVYNNLASYYYSDNNIDSALYYLLIAKDIFLYSNKLHQAATSIYNVSTLYFDKEIYDSSLYYLDSALVIFEMQDNRNGVANIYSLRSKLCLVENNYEKALQHLHNCLDIRSSIGNLQLKSQTLLELSNLYVEVADYNKAYDYYLEYSKLKDSIFNENVSSKISELNISYETQKKEKEIILLKKEAEIKKSFSRLLIVGIIALLLLLVLLITFIRVKIKLAKNDKLFYKQQKDLNVLKIEKQKAEKLILEKEVQRQIDVNKLQEQKHSAELSHRNRELVTATMHLLNKNKTIAEISEYLKLLMTSNKQQPAQLREILRKIDNSVNLDSDWEQFKMHFEKVNTDFFATLQEMHPDLSHGDHKVCAYLKINLSFKEIAQMMNISMSGIHKRMYRIRKKMKLDHNINLTKYLSEI